MKYNPLKIEKKWQKRWEKEGIFSPDLTRAKRPFYNLMMFPYPSAEGLHIGNVYAFVHSDAFGRYMRLLGFDVFEPIGLDGFGIHSENYALKIKEHILDVSKRTEKHFYKQLRMLGNQYDWKRTLETYKPEYYKWTQWIFVQMFKNGLAYRAKSYVNWCPSCQTVLADEQVESGVCERCKTGVEKKELEQWFFRITAYAERLLKNLECLAAEALGPKVKISKEMAEAGINWSERTKIAQREWLGKSEGVVIDFRIKNYELGVKVFTTRLDTIFGCTYLVLAPEHKIIADLRPKIENLAEVEKYIAEAKKKSEIERSEIVKQKTGVELKGIKALNPFNGEQIPVFVADYVLGYYGTGAVMAVPSHDSRDFAFAKNYGLSMRQVILPAVSKSQIPNLKSQTARSVPFGTNGSRINPKPQSQNQPKSEVFEEDGILVNSGDYNCLSSEEAREKMAKWLEEKKLGGKKTNYKLRDWCISRQRYWGPPIPLVFCENCAVKIKNQKSKIKNNKFNKGELENPGWVAVPEKDLPVLLPKTNDYLPRSDGLSPLARNKKFVKVKCPKCGGPARRETDVSDTFLDSSWYFFRYPSVEFKDRIFDKKRTKKWLPVDMYIGGQEHAVLHLLYSRFITMFFRDLGLVDFEEPYKRFFAHGLLIKEGAKISKSRGNIVNPDQYIKKYGADAVRLYLMFLGKVERGGDWRDSGIAGMFRFVNRIWNVFKEPKKYGKGVSDLSFMHKTIKKVGGDLERLSFNTAIARIMEYLNWYKEKEPILTKKERKKILETLLLLLSPFAPHLCEELWEKHILKVRGSRFEVRSSIFCQPWPRYDPKLVKEEKITLIVQINGRVRDKLEADFDISEEEARSLTLEREKIKKWIEGKEIKKIIFVPGRLVNIVLRQPLGYVKTN